VIPLSWSYPELPLCRSLTGSPHTHKLGSTAATSPGELATYHSSILDIFKNTHIGVFGHPVCGFAEFQRCQQNKNHAVTLHINKKNTECFVSQWGRSFSVIL
jgi:hypothetical protein